MSATIRRLSVVLAWLFTNTLMCMTSAQAPASDAKVQGNQTSQQENQEALPRSVRNPLVVNPAAEFSRMPDNAPVSKEMLRKWPCVSTYHRYVDVTCFGAVGDGQHVRDASIEAGGNMVTSPSGLFQPQDVGKKLVIQGAGAEGGPLESEITQYTSSGKVMLRDAARQAVPKGKAYWGTDSTAAITNAWNAAKNEDLPLYIPAGTFFYDGAGLGGWGRPRIEGNGKESSTVLIGAGKYFVDDLGNWSQLDVRGLRFFGGAGALRDRDPKAADASEYLVEDNDFQEFTGAAISNNARDNPYWTISKNHFAAANTATSICIALAGANDTSTIADNAFENYRIAIKLASGGSNVHVTRNGFLQFSNENVKASYRRVAIWTLPIGPYPAGGAGFTVTFNKFGNENMDPADLRVLYAAEGPGTYFGDRLPLEAPTDGIVFGQIYSGNVVFGIGSTATPFVYSFTPNVRNNIYQDFETAGTLMGNVLEFDPSILPLPESSTNRMNICGPVVVSPSTSNVHPPFGSSNGVGACVVIDPNGEISYQDVTVAGPWAIGTGQAGFLNLLNGDVPGFTATAARASAIADATGQGNAVALELTQQGQIGRAFTAMPVEGKPIWAEFDLKAAGPNSVKFVLVKLRANGTNAVVWQREIAVPPAAMGWKHYRVRFVPRAIPASNFSFMVGAPAASAGGDVAVGRIYVYQAWEPLSGTQHLGTLNVDEGMYCLNSTFCMRSGQGAPQGKCAAGIYLRTDSNTVYQCDGGTWKTPLYAK